MQMCDRDRQVLRLLKRLRQGAARPEPGAMPGRVTLPGPSGGMLCFARETLDTARQAGHVEATRDGCIRISAKGAEWLDSAAVGQAGRTSNAAKPEPVRPVQRNPAESPLDLLARRKDRHGRPFLSPEEVEAGERLRSDCEKARLAPRLGPNWDVQAAAGRHAGVRGGLEDLAAAALDARRRVGKALDAAGPELAGLLLDICCFLKGLEQVEMERQWPRRSAKLLIKTGLTLLARHYGILPRGPKPSQSILHWGTEDFRPALQSGMP